MSYSEYQFETGEIAFTNNVIEIFKEFEQLVEQVLRKMNSRGYMYM
jgi:hypothetical protein